MENISAGASLSRPLFGDFWACGDYYSTLDGQAPEEDDNFLVKGHPWIACDEIDPGGFIKLVWRLEKEVLLEESIYAPQGSAFFIRTSCKAEGFIRDDIQVETDYEVDERLLTIDFLKP